MGPWGLAFWPLFSLGPSPPSKRRGFQPPPIREKRYAPRSSPPTTTHPPTTPPHPAGSNPRLPRRHPHSSTMGYVLSAIGYIAGYLAILFQAIAIGKFKSSWEGCVGGILGARQATNTGVPTCPAPAPVCRVRVGCLWPWVAVPWGPANDAAAAAVPRLSMHVTPLNPSTPPLRTRTHHHASTCTRSHGPQEDFDSLHPCLYNQLPPFPFPLPPRNKQPAACTTPQNLQRSTPRRPSASSPGPSRPW